MTKNSIAHGGPVLWNIIIIYKDKNFCNTSYKNLKRKIDSMEIFRVDFQRDLYNNYKF